ncbi:MAG TPA: carboxypeptidase-like regulatory domain-containing protein [Bryobacteraceae bacterium]|nr:carboxypeptidase-like regulatory domain-containing protein [Bryobacteraceae bacterium]
MRLNTLAAVFALPAIALAQNGAAALPAPGNVALPLDEYNRLVDLAGKVVKKPEAPPAAWALKSAVLKLQAGSDSVCGTIDLEGEVFAKSQTSVPLVSAMTIFEAQRQGRELPLEHAASSTQAVLPSGDFSVTLRAGLPLRIEAGSASFTLPVPAAGSVLLTLVIPADRTTVHLSPGVITSRSSSGGQTTIEATLAPGPTATIWWAARESVAPAAPREVRFLSDVKTLVSVSEAAINLVALVDLTVVQGDPGQFEIELPAGYGVTGVTGPSLDSSDTQPGVLTVKVRNAAVRSHQFLISMEKNIDAAVKADIPFVTVKATQRETGEVLVEGAGSLELAARESGALKRMDLKETSPILHTLAHDSLTAAFRYHRQAADVPGLALEWVRFPDAALPPAIAQSATVTTVVTTQGRSLTEIKLVVKNQSQPFLKVGLPAGTTILSADVAGEKVKPAEGPDGQRVPLLRPGFRPNGEYTVSFVFLHAGIPFAKKGGSELALPKMDMPVGLVNWEVFLPDRFKVADFGGNTIPQAVVESAGWDPAAGEGAVGLGALAAAGRRQFVPPVAVVSGMIAPAPVALAPGMVGGLVTDPQGAVIPGAQITVKDSSNGRTQTTRTDSSGRWAVAGFSSGRLTVTADATGFKRQVQQLPYSADNPWGIGTKLEVGNVTETVTVTAEAPMLETSSANVSNSRLNTRTMMDLPVTPPPSNVLDLKQKVAGVLPIAIDVPRTGTSYRFVKPLVIDEETTVSFAYRTR